MYIRIGTVLVIVVVALTITLGQEQQTLTQAQRALLDIPEIVYIYAVCDTKLCRAGGSRR